jgi:serine/threonine protein kinase
MEMTGLESLLQGRVLVDRYRIEEVIGRGGMGAVYRAVDERLGRRVAVKVITVMGGADPEMRERIRARFRQEAAAVARLPHHPNVVPVYDYGTDPALGLDFMVMELLRGEDLATRLADSGPPPLPLALEILFQAARGLAVGHRAGVIHRDVKPGNVFLVHPDEPEELQVRVLDFGIAKVVAEEETFAQLTQDGRAPLSPAYASPEQLRAEGRLTPASDVFSLGALGFQLLSGERPFTEADRNRMGIGLPVPTPSLRARNPAVPPSVEEVIRRALANEPEERFPNAGAFAEALDRARRALGDQPLPPYAPPGFVPGTAAGQEEDDRTLLAPPPTRAVPPTRAAPPPPVRPAPRPRPVQPEPKKDRSFLWALLGVLLVAGAVFAWLSSGGGRRTADEELAGLPDSAVVDTPATPAADTLSPAERAAEEGRTLLEGGAYDQALEQFRQAAELDPENAGYRYSIGYALLQLGRLEEAETELRRALGMNPNQTAAYRQLADAVLARGDTAAAIASLDEYLQRSTYEAGRREAQALLDRLRGAQLPAPDSATDTTGITPDTTAPAPPGGA